MGRKLTTFYLLFSILFFLALAVMFAVRVQDLRKASIARIGGDFDGIRKTVEATYRQQESFDSAGFKGTAKSLFDSEPDLNVLVIYSYETGIEYLRARSAEYLSSRLTDIAAIKGVPQFSYNSFSQTKITSSITIPHKKSFILEGVYRVIDEKRLYPVLRDTVLLLVVFALVTSILFVFLRYCRGTEPRTTIRGAGGHAEEPARKTEAEQAEKTGAPAEREAAASSPGDVTEKAEAIKTAEALQTEEKPVEPAASPVPEVPRAEEPQAEAAVPSKAERKTDSKQGLFSPESGLGWQEYLEKRLTLELERAAFNEQDLSLVLMKYKDLEKPSSDYRTIAKEILDKMAFEDLAFEYKDGYAVILPNSNLDQTIRTMTDFHRKVDEGITHTFGKPQCGITSRNGRLVDGYRLIIEAEQALDRTSPKDSDCIVGFRTDPGKYRKYLSDRGAQTRA